MNATESNDGNFPAPVPTSGDGAVSLESYNSPGSLSIFASMNIPEKDRSISINRPSFNGHNSFTFNHDNTSHVNRVASNSNLANRNDNMSSDARLMAEENAAQESFQVAAENPLTAPTFIVLAKVLSSFIRSFFRSGFRECDRETRNDAVIIATILLEKGPIDFTRACFAFGLAEALLAAATCPALPPPLLMADVGFLAVPSQETV
eukprot:CAMPEP_0175046036 /NCGR_PEP_ID=MMETSP0052_2-20121109/4799_1 /TAXON_ID=51329 ORGANISM="Polytomella parva, Strain SAG 63-3" /NCGR_SAMPLE_ID=MMETSP0052_2 /ASSEMBLY_ACC=CAM_ASM_000194 /LENGTH=205 /DNA_ID=CAMNT_0016309721 /DNA_START=1149 /DNA_END=1763 /DNA_ORIENTATION=-